MASVPQLDQDIKKKLVPSRDNRPTWPMFRTDALFIRAVTMHRTMPARDPQLVSLGGKHEKACWVDVNK